MKALRFCVDEAFVEERKMRVEVCVSTDQLPSRDVLESCEKEGDWWEVIDCIDVDLDKFFQATGIEPGDHHGKPILEGITVLQFHDEIDLDAKSLEDIFDSSTDFLEFTKPAKQAIKELYSELLGGN
jgi:hypothetical protein